MKRRNRTAIWIGMLLICHLLAGCGDESKVSFGYRPPLLPVQISIDSQGNLEVSFAGNVQTPIGTFSAGLVADRHNFFPNAEGTLTVRIDGRDTVYDLQGQENIHINLESGYYKQIDLRKNGNNWYLEVAKIASSPSTHPVAATPSHIFASGCDSTAKDHTEPRLWRREPNRMNGPKVKFLQTRLLELGYELPTAGADGWFGPETEAAVREFQRRNGLEVDGIVGPITWACLKNPHAARASD
jgi:hypothetical protein